MMSTFGWEFQAAFERVNKAGFSSHAFSSREQVRNFLRCGTLTGTFYVSAQALAREMLDTLVRFAAQDPDVLCEETIAARTDGYMRMMPLVSLAVLSGIENKLPFYRAAEQVLRVPRDVAQFVVICQSGKVPGVNGFGGCRVKAVQKWLESLSSYHAVKGTEMREMRLTDLVRLAHPRPKSDSQRELLGWVSGHVPARRLEYNEQVMALEKLKRETDPLRQAALIREGRLPYEAVVPVVDHPTKEVWRALLEQAPLFNLLRNLLTFTLHGVFEDPEAVELAVQKLTRPGALREAKILPFQCYTAWKAYRACTRANLKIVAALSDAIESSVTNFPVLEGRVVIAPDVSGSMNTTYTNKQQTTKVAEVAGIFAAGLLARSAHAVVMPFDERVRDDVRLNPRDSILTNAQVIGDVKGWATALCAPIDRLTRTGNRVDLFVGITDNEEWVGHGFLQAWRGYRAQVAPEARAVLVTVVPGSDAPVPAGEPGVSFVHGWSDSVLKYVAEASGLCRE